MKVWNTVFRILAPFALIASANAYATEVPSAPILIKKVNVKGSGCPDASTVGVNISDDKQAFTLTFSEFAAETGPGIPLSASRKNCVATLVLDVPSGWQYSIGSFYYRGFMQLDQAIRAEHTTNYFFEGQGRTGSFASTSYGPFADEYVYQDVVGLASAVWSTCSVKRALNINTSVRVYNADKLHFPDSQGFITNDSIDGEIRQIWGLSWRRC